MFDKGKASLKRLLNATDCLVVEPKAESAFIAAALLKADNLQAGVLCLGRDNLAFNREKYSNPGPTRRALLVGYGLGEPEELEAVLAHLKSEDYDVIGIVSYGESESFVKLCEKTGHGVPDWMLLPFSSLDRDPSDTLSGRLQRAIDNERLGKDDELACCLLKASRDETCSAYPQLKLFELAGFTENIGYAVHNLARERWNEQGSKSADQAEAMVARVAHMASNRQELSLDDGGKVALFKIDKAAMMWSVNAGSDLSYLTGFMRQQGYCFGLLENGLVTRSGEPVGTSPRSKFGHKSKDLKQTSDRTLFFAGAYHLPRVESERLFPNIVHILNKHGIGVVKNITCTSLYEGLDLLGPVTDTELVSALDKLPRW